MSVYGLLLQGRSQPELPVREPQRTPRAAAVSGSDAEHMRTRRIMPSPPPSASSQDEEGKTTAMNA
jgi:hypothetical protein